MLKSSGGSVIRYDAWKVQLRRCIGKKLRSTMIIVWSLFESKSLCHL